MGKFKRHSKRYKTQVVHTPNGDMTASVSIPEPRPRPPRAPLTKSLLREFFLSLKRRNQFGNFIYSHKPLVDILRGSDRDNSAYGYTVTRMCLSFKDVDYYHPGLPIEGLRFSTENFNTPLKRLSILHGILINRRVRFEDGQLIGDVLEPYISDELAKRNKRIYPNEMAFGFFFGTLFAVIGLVLIFGLLCRLFSPSVGIIYVIFNCVALVILKILMKVKRI
jgi:hypothetical protein